MLNTELQRWLLVDCISCWVKQEKAVKQGDSISVQAAMLEYYRRVLQSKRVSTLHHGSNKVNASVTESYRSLTMSQKKMALPGDILAGYAAMLKYTNASSQRS